MVPVSFSDSAGRRARGAGWGCSSRCRELGRGRVRHSGSRGREVQVRARGQHDQRLE
jgi:hypothetical protein